ncbi:hypothetical protein JTB14_016536 [Gonioctena quinquepunctata]|nr:hypothetical protein JTB14_016536 [Gonioctena quinquepunctata]
MDEFTSRLMQRKVDKWSSQKPHQKITEKCAEPRFHEGISEDIPYLSEDKLNDLFQYAVDVNDNERVIKLMKQSQNGDKDMINTIRKLCDELCPEVLETNSNFQHYIAEAVWVKGNTNESLRIFQNVYKNNAYLRRRIRLMLKFLIENVVLNRSEAALVSVIKFSEELKKEYIDFFPLTCVWQACFLSEWFTDQCIAFDLMNKHDGLCFAVISRIPFVVAISLRGHRTEVVYRLLEVLLHFKLKVQYEGVLLALLDYQIRQGDIRSCLEIVQWSLENNVQLPPVHHEKFLNLLLYSDEDSSLRKKLTTPNVPKVEPHFKF